MAGDGENSGEIPRDRYSAPDRRFRLISSLRQSAVAGFMLNCLCSAVLLNRAAKLDPKKSSRWSVTKQPP